MATANPKAVYICVNHGEASGIFIWSEWFEIMSIWSKSIDSIDTICYNMNR